MDSKDINIAIPKDVLFLIDTLESAGFEAYIVGGCVRDSILGIEPNDWDITTAAKPDEVIELFKEFKVLPTGLKHGTVTIIMDSGHYEITTFRVENGYSDSRHPDEVIFVTNLKEDLSRRDFTINAMAYSPKHGLVDLFGGLDDLKNKNIMTVGLPSFRFHEDALRVFRALRFSARFDYKISDAILYEIENDSELIELLKRISKERICTELRKTIEVENYGSQYLMTLHLFAKTLGKIIPDIRNYIGYEWLQNYKQFIQLSDDLPEGSYLRYALFFDTIDCEKIMRELRFDNNTIHHVNQIIACGLDILEFYDGRKRKHKARKLLRDYDYCDIVDAISYAKIHGKHVNVCDYLRTALEEVYSNKDECYKINHLKVDGNDAIACGFTGKNCGAILNYLLDMVITEWLKNNRDDLLEEMRCVKEDEV